MASSVVVVSEQLPVEALDLLRSRCEVRRVDGGNRQRLLAALPGASVLVVRSGTRVDAELIAAGSSLRGVVRAGVGLDNVDVRAAQAAGVQVVNTPGVNAVSVAELTVGLLLSLMRHIPEAAQHVRESRWDRSAFLGGELAGKVLGIIGMGRIGTQVARRLAAFDMEILAHDRYLPDEDIRRAGAEPVELDELLRRCDAVTVHLPKTSETAGLLGERELALLKPTARLVNTARGGIIDEDALARALRHGRIAAAALDVFGVEPPEDSPLLGLRNVLPTPHLGAGTKEAQVRAGREAARIALRFITPSPEPGESRPVGPVAAGRSPVPAR